VSCNSLIAAFDELDFLQLCLRELGGASLLLLLRTFGRNEIAQCFEFAITNSEGLDIFLVQWPQTHPTLIRLIVLIEDLLTLFRLRHVAERVFSSSKDRLLGLVGEIRGEGIGLIVEKVPDPLLFCAFLEVEKLSFCSDFGLVNLGKLLLDIVGFSFHQ
jgi:hypothetical protein